MRPRAGFAPRTRRKLPKKTQSIMLQETNVRPIEKVVIRFAGDSGDGMQLAGNIFSNISAERGDQISTFPDYPAEIRAPQDRSAAFRAIRSAWEKASTPPATKPTCSWQ